MADLTLASRYNVEKKPEHFFQCSDGHAHTAPVGQFRPNGFGLFDMLGNAWEWTADCWNANYNGAPTNGDYWRAPGDCSLHVARGGSWVNNPRDLRAGYRDRDSAGFRINDRGFRVARAN